MLASLLTAGFFALSAICAHRSTIYFGSQRANLARQIVALILLGLWAHILGQGLHGATLGIFFISGVIGFGLGDWALFEAFPRIGSSLTLLLCQCLAVPIAAITEWLWLGTHLSFLQISASMVILVGIALALTPSSDSAIPAGHRIAGIIFGVIAAAGQAGGAVVSRYGFARAHEAGFFPDGITTAYQRLWGGVASITVLLLLRQLTRRWRIAGAPRVRPDWGRGWPWILANAITGAFLGVSCYQWALESTPSAIVLPIVATAPLITMTIAAILEGYRPTYRVVIGSILSVLGVAMLVTNK